MRRILLAGALLVLLVPATASAQSKQTTAYKVFLDYVKDGNIDPCKYTPEQLQAALKGITPDIRQYASDFPSAIRDAIAARARGECDADQAAATPSPTATTPAADATPAPTTASGAVVGAPPGPGGDAGAPGATVSDAALDRAAAASPDNDAPAPLIGLGILGALLLMSGATLVALRRLGVGEGRLAPAYHSWREAMWRAGGVWDDFRDWARLGR